jgi:malate dehydrogenase
MRNKISIIGAGQVGATTAQLCGMFELGDVVLVDIAEGLAQGKALDIQQSLAISRRESVVSGTGDMSHIAGSQVVVITAGFPRKPGMSREDLVRANGKIIQDIAKKVATYAPGAIVINVTNPMDIMTCLVQKTSNLPSNRVLGMGGILDSGRFKAEIMKKTGASPDQVFALVIGMHGDSMVPLPRYTTVSGKPLSTFLSQEEIRDLTTGTIHGGAEIVRLLQTGSAYYAPAAAIVEMLSSILFDRRKVLPCAAYLQGEYGQEDIYIGVPVKLSSQGLDEIIEFELDPPGRAAFEKSCQSAREMIQMLYDLSLIPS